MDHNLFSTRLQSGNRTYFFDLKTTKNGDPYLQIIESKRKGEAEFERRQIIVFDEGIHKFSQKITEVVEKIQVEQNSYVSKKRNQFPNAYQPWTPEEDDQLELLYCEGRKPAELIRIFWSERW
ncbi:DUF3276 family protein [Salinimicrobium sp. WS361]|uniref:DUF3276 family protein n=1 Tax=Salinimicrobium sp. WS361 TaxID=3425123 RepID=UPI003D6EE118